MLEFVAAAAIAVVLVLLLLFVPLLRKSRHGAPSRTGFNATLYRAELAELERERDSGVIDEMAFGLAHQDMRQRLLEDTSEADAVATLRSPKWTIVAVTLLLPAAAAGIYLGLGRPAQSAAGAAAPQAARQDVEKMVSGLAAKLEKDPGNLKGWSMLGRSYKVMGRTVEAEQAFDRAGAILDNDAQLLADYADVAATNAGGNLAGKPTQIIERALKADPKNAMALWLAGTAAYKANDNKGALRYWEQLAGQLDPDSEDSHTILASIDEVRAKDGLPPRPVQVAAAAPAASAAAAPNEGAAVSGIVDLDRSLKGKAAPEETMMIIARAPGQRMPVAVMRAKVSDLPLKFVLDDSLAMSPTARISALKEVSVEARISKTGLAKPESGDLISSAQIVKVGAGNVKIAVDQIRP